MFKVKIKKLSISTLLIVLLGLAIVVLSGVIFIPKIQRFVEEKRQNDGTLVLNKYDFGSISVASDLSEEEVNSAVNFMKTSLSENFLPEEISITLAMEEKDDRPAEYRGNWNKDGNFISILYVPGPRENEPQYLRIWTLYPYESVTTSDAKSLAGNLFNEGFVNSIGEINCREVDMQSGGKLTECGSLKTKDNGILQGITIRGPVEIEDDPQNEFTVVSACYVPKEGTQFYSSDLCI